MNREKQELIIQALLDDIKFSKDNLGINSNGYMYHIIDNTQSRRLEHEKTNEFLNDLIKNNPKYFNNSQIEFINYGDTELVYVVDENGYKRTLLVGQPCTSFGEVKTEYDNLIKLHNENPDLVICPIAYFYNDDREAYLTPYIYQARCIASQDIGYGSYIPDPYYRFEKYNEDDEYIITSVMVANLVKLYNTQEKLALASCKIGGGDFILEKEYDKEPHTIENALKRMHLIAARKLIKIEFKDYLNLLRTELVKRTYYNNIVEKDPNIIINLKNRIPIKEEAVENGITLGLKLRKID